MEKFSSFFELSTFLALIHTLTWQVNTCSKLYMKTLEKVMLSVINKSNEADRCLFKVINKNNRVMWWVLCWTSFSSYRNQSVGISNQLTRFRVMGTTPFRCLASWRCNYSLYCFYFQLWIWMCELGLHKGLFVTSKFFLKN